MNVGTQGAMYCICTCRVLFMSDSLSSVWGHSVHFAKFRMLRFSKGTLKRSYLSNIAIIHKAKLVSSDKRSNRMSKAPGTIVNHFVQSQIWYATWNSHRAEWTDGLENKTTRNKTRYTQYFWPRTCCSIKGQFKVTRYTCLASKLARNSKLHIVDLTTKRTMIIWGYGTLAHHVP